MYFYSGGLGITAAVESNAVSNLLRGGEGGREGGREGGGSCGS